MTDLKDYQQIMENIGVRQMIFQGPPGTSKTFESKKFVLKQLNPESEVFTSRFVSQEDISSALDTYKLNESDYANPAASAKLSTGGWDLVQFHPSYGYEDFIRGIEVKADGGLPSYNSVNRILGKIAEFAKVAEKTNPDEPPKFYLVIDEINRANIATVFGELIYGLEYRDSKVSTPYEVEDKVSTPVSRTKDIVLGKNLFIIGTMNTSDQNVFTLDTAFQRRWDMRLIENDFTNIDSALANAEILDTTVTWKNFCIEINNIVIGNSARMTSAEDKRLGAYFVHLRDLKFNENMGDLREYDSLRKKESKGSLTDEEEAKISDIREAIRQNRKFPEKVIKYLWDDAFKFNREVIFETAEYQSLEQVIRAFMYAKGLERFKIFKDNVRDAFTDMKEE